MAEPLGPREVNVLREQITRATPAPWMADAARGLVNSDGRIIARLGAGLDTLDAEDAANGELIAQMHDAVPRLVATVDALTTERDRLLALVRDVAAITVTREDATAPLHAEMAAALVLRARALLDE